MKTLRRIDAGLARAEGWLLVLSLLGLLGLGVTQIVLRFTGVSLDWADEVMRNVTLWIGFIGASIATHEGKHINVDALTRFLRPKARAIVSAIVQVAGNVARFGGDAGAVTAAGIPVALWQAIMPLAFALIGARCLLHGVESLRHAITGEPPPTHATTPAPGHDVVAAGERAP